MHKLYEFLALSFGVLVLSITSVSAMGLSEPVSEGDITVSNGWVRETIGPGTVTAAYLTIENTGTEADTLQYADAEIADATEIHTHKMSGGLMKMVRVDELEIGPGQTRELAPGGDHLMLIDLADPLGVGDEVELVLTFEEAGDLIVVLPVVSGRSGHAH